MIYVEPMYRVIGETICDGQWETFQSAWDHDKDRVIRNKQEMSQRVDYRNLAIEGRVSVEGNPDELDRLVKGQAVPLQDYVVLVGNLEDGYACFGSFSSWLEANEWAESTAEHPWTVMRVQRVEQ